MQFSGLLVFWLVCYVLVCLDLGWVDLAGIACLFRLLDVVCYGFLWFAVFVRWLGLVGDVVWVGDGLF